MVLGIKVVLLGNLSVNSENEIDIFNNFISSVPIVAIYCNITGTKCLLLKAVMIFVIITEMCYNNRLLKCKHGL